MRCSIAHAKGDVDEYIAVPTVSDSEIGLEIKLIKYVAYEALKYSLQGTTQGNGLTGGLPPVRFSM